MARLAPRLLDLHELGLTTVFVGNGLPSHIDGFIARHGLGDKKVTVVTDPSLKTFAAAGFARSVWSTLGPRAVWGELRAFGAGYRQYGIEGDPYQQGGVVLVDQDGTIAYYYANATPGAHADTGDIVDVAFKLLVRRDGAGRRRLV